MSEATLHLAVKGEVAFVTLTRPDAHNTLDEALAGNLAQAFQKLSVLDAVRVVVLAAKGKSFCAGMDPDRLRRLAGAEAGELQRDDMELAVLLDAIDRCAKPVVAVVHGPAAGIGVALAAAADIVIASDEASFTLMEVRHGTAPALALPYLVESLGERACRRYLLTGERFDARDAHRLGLVHVLVPAAKLEEARALVVDQLLKGAPKAQGAIKELIRVVADTPAGPDRMRYAAGRNSELRAAPEGREGLAALMEGRKPSWVKG